MKKHSSDCNCKTCKASRDLARSLAVEPTTEAANDTTRIALPTGSKTDRFLGCQWWVGREVTDSEVGEEALFGSAFHEVMAGVSKPKAAAAKFGVLESADEIARRAKAADAVMKRWLRGENPWKLRFDKWRLERETAITYNMETSTSRRCAPPTEDTHEYLDRQPDEIPSTIDLLGVGIVKTNHAVLVIDYKSGFDIGAPYESGQLLTLALAACRLYGAARAFIGFLHAPGHMEPTVYADSVDAEGLETHASALLAAHRSDRRSLTPDYYCKWCQAFSACPVNSGALVELRTTKTLATAEDVGAAHQKLSEMKKRFEALAAQVDAEIRSWIAQNGDATRPDGREVGFVSRHFSNLSQASIKRALGELKGAREIERLRKLGCIEEGERSELRVK